MFLCLRRSDHRESDGMVHTWAMYVWTYVLTFRSRCCLPNVVWSGCDVLAEKKFINGKNFDFDLDQLASYGTSHFTIVAFGLVGSRGG